MAESLSGVLLPPVEPPPVAWWPPAPGWWLLAALTLLVLIALPWLLRWLRLRQLRRQRAQRLLDQIPETLPDRDWLAALNTLLKRIARHRGAEYATRLHGTAWLDYLCATCPRAQRSALEPLASALYQPAPELSADQRRQLRRELRRWIRHNHV